MGAYSNELIKYEDGFIIKNYNKATIIVCCFLLPMIIFFVSTSILTLIWDFQENKFGSHDFPSIIKIIILTFSCILFNNAIKKIIINTKEKEIMFRYGLFPIKRRKLKFNDIKEILITHNTSDYSTRPNRFQTIVRENTYNMDIIDKEQNAYRIHQSQAYNDEVIEFSKKLGEIINIPINDQSNVEYNKLLYKRII
ncbi:MAG: hypothetical protein LBI28_09105 [Treponema sp.]|jgi:hypothetical protein|nr:hypothetical protein [Treponema sp.]